MKLILVFALGIAPLAALTVSSLFGRGPAGAASAAHDPKGAPDLAAAKKLAKAGTSVADKEQAVVRRFADLEIFRDTLPNFTANDGGERWKPVATAWSELKKAQDACAALAKLYAALPRPGGTISLESERDELAKYLETNPLAGLNGSGDLEGYLREKRDKAAERLSSTQLLTEVRAKFESKLYSDCLREIKRIQRDVLTATERSELEQLEKKSKFGEHWAVELAVQDSAKSRWMALEERVRTSPEPADTRDRDLLARKNEQIAQLKRWAKVDALFDPPGPSRLVDLAEDCRQILEDDPDARPRLRDGTKAWLEARITVKALNPPPNALVREAWGDKGLYLRGVFEVASKPEETTVRYKYWEDVKAKKERPGDYRSYYSIQFSKQPAKLTEVRVCEEFKEARQKLLKKIDSERSWHDFAEKCESLQAELENYKQRGKLSVAADLKLAQEVIGEWRTFGMLFK